LPAAKSLTHCAPASAFRSRSLGYALYGQGQWTLRSLTLNRGVRSAHRRGYIPERTRRGGAFTPPIPIARIDDVPNWKDINPRLGAAYDLFGNSKTAVKFSFGRYVLFDAITYKNNINPATEVVTNATMT